MNQTSSPYRIEAGCNRHFSAETFCANGTMTPYSGSLDRVSC
jgi:hypothetical protein